MSATQLCTFRLLNASTSAKLVHQQTMIPTCKSQTVAQVLGLANLGIKALALTSITPKEQITSMYNQMDSDTDIRLVYGELSNPMGSCAVCGTVGCSVMCKHIYAWSVLHVKALCSSKL